MQKKLLITLYFAFSMIAITFGQIKLLESPPAHYICPRALHPIVIDGKAYERDWLIAPWTDSFMDIEGPQMPAPYYDTRVKMLWDDQYLYILAVLEEQHLWATYRERESVIFHENDFEVFIDPDGDTHNYYELEINALGTIWDLMLTKPYKNNGLPISVWDIRGFQYGIDLRGTLNDPSDVDSGWTIEMAIPWKIITEAAPGKRVPQDGEYWRINFSRVQWKIEECNGTYRKMINPETGYAYPEFNWVWSPQWAINMHMPEYWGYLIFSGHDPEREKTEFILPEQEKSRYLLRELYYLQQSYFERNGQYASSAKDLNLDNEIMKEFAGKVTFDAAKKSYTLSVPLDNEQGWLHISDDSRIWKSR
ncbi:MAG: carbohydrate-binding family 9-like protein [Bacteroidota bacterium]